MQYLIKRGPKTFQTDSSTIQRDDTHWQLVYTDGIWLMPGKVISISTPPAHQNNTSCEGGHQRLI